MAYFPRFCQERAIGASGPLNVFKLSSVTVRITVIYS